MREIVAAGFYGLIQIERAAKGRNCHLIEKLPLPQQLPGIRPQEKPENQKQPAYQ